jgi:hypothetical protein
MMLEWGRRESDDLIFFIADILPEKRRNGKSRQGGFKGRL